MPNARSARIAARWLLVAASAQLITAALAQAAEPKADEKSAEAAIRATADAFIQAFNRGDAKAVAALWTPDGSLIDDRGQPLRGRKAIEDEYAAFFKEHPGVKMEVAVGFVEVPVPGTAIEDGMARATPREGASAAASRYTAVHVLQDGKWLMASVRESGVELPSHYGRLQSLEWLVGKWEAKSNGATIDSIVRWVGDRSFLEREYTVRRDGVTTSSGLQIIGWDPQSGQIRSWSFDSSGGHGMGLWTPTQEGWRIESSGVLADGTPSSSQDFVIRVPGEDDVLGWRSTNRKVAAEPLPDTDEVVMERIK